MTPEGRVKAKVKKALDHLGPECWRFMPVQVGYGSVALDFLLAIRGRFVAIETKAPGKKLTPLQEQTKAAIEAAGGLVFVVWDESSLAIAMKVILALEFAPPAPNSHPLVAAGVAFDSIRNETGQHDLSFRAVRHGTQEAEWEYEKHERSEQSAQAPDQAVGRDHGAPGATPAGQPKPRSRCKNQRTATEIT